MEGERRGSRSNLPPRPPAFSLRGDAVAGTSEIARAIENRSGCKQELVLAIKRNMEQEL